MQIPQLIKKAMLTPDLHVLNPNFASKWKNENVTNLATEIQEYGTMIEHVHYLYKSKVFNIQYLSNNNDKK